ncbi:MAG: diguanylate cyclase, partial [Lachnospiraceae bacterium]
MDFSARIGGEEFVVFLNGMEKDEALRCANTLKNRVEQLQITQAENNFLPFVTISIGVEWGNVRKGVTFDQLQEKADGFLYKAKEAGRACICMNGICHHRTLVQKNK